jgi:hypothetical protein
LFCSNAITVQSRKREKYPIAETAIPFAQASTAGIKSASNDAI